MVTSKTCLTSKKIYLSAVIKEVDEKISCRLHLIQGFPKKTPDFQNLKIFLIFNNTFIFIKMYDYKSTEMITRKV